MHSICINDDLLNNTKGANMELKTLKQLTIERSEESNMQNLDLFIDDLREEAIKWIKSKHIRKFTTTFDSDLFSNAMESRGAEKILKYFFNITEEELQ